MKVNSFIKLFFVFVFLFLGFSPILGQSGKVSGVITDDNGLYIPGVSIFIDGTKIGTTSDFNGFFTIFKVPEGVQKVKVSSIGYKSQEYKVEIHHNTTRFLKIILKPDTTILDEVTISTAIGGEVKALNKQKSNLNITNVISTDQIGKFPDVNVGDAIKRVPGITMQTDQGEARNVIIRGLSPQLNSVTLNGSRIPSAEANNRNVQMDLIPSDMIQTIEVNKAVTPDMDGDALGGSVNLITRTAPQDFRLSATVGSGVSFIVGKRIMSGGFLLGDRSENKKFGWMFSASINDVDYGSDNIEAKWKKDFSFTKDEGIKKLKVNPFVSDFQQRTYFIERVRRSVAANFDYQVDDNNQLFFKSMYNWRDDQENRFKTKMKLRKASKIKEDDFSIINNQPVWFLADITRETKGGINNDLNRNKRLEDQRMLNCVVGGKHVFQNLKFDWKSVYSKASEERLNERYASFKSKYIVNTDISDTKFPIFTAKTIADFNDLSKFEYDGITEENQYTEEEDLNIFTNFELPVYFIKERAGVFKFGLRTRLKKKYKNNDFYEFDLSKQFANLSEAQTSNYTDSDFLAGKKYRAGFFATPQWLGNLELQNGVLVYDEFLGGNFKVLEDVYAGYAMVNQQLFDNFYVLVGLRIEHTKNRATGNVVEYDSDGNYKDHYQNTKEKTYTNFLPGVHLKYMLNGNTNFRFAYTNTIARPNYVDIVPYANILREEEEIELGNSKLNPVSSVNFDFMFEHYFSNIGLISAGMFYKQIRNFAYTKVTTLLNDSFGKEANGYRLKQPKNGDDAYVYGAEFAYQRKLNFLPGFAKNFNIYLNYTYLTSRAKGMVTNSSGQERFDMGLPNTSPNMFNTSLGYDDGKLSARVSLNFSDAYLDEIGENSFYDSYYDKQMFLDVNVGYTIHNKLRFYIDFTNLTNQPLRYYQGESLRTMQAEYYGKRLALGLKYDLFKK